MQVKDIATSITVHDGLATIQATQDCTPVMEQAIALHNEGRLGSSEMRHAARLPAILVEKYCLDNNVLFSEFCADPAHVRRMLQDPALAHFRIWRGKV
jgi:hypothetical protein